MFALTQQKRHTIILALFFAFGFLLRTFNLNWDSGFHFHPDERMLLIVADRIHLFNNLNPQFFNYGTLPVYLVKALSQTIGFFIGRDIANYNEMLLIGRSVAVAADLATMLVVYKIAILITKKAHLALHALFFYAIAFFPIQNSHFFIVDGLLTLFATLLIYTLLLTLKKQKITTLILISLLVGALLATKASAIIFIPIVIGVLLLPHFPFNTTAKFKKSVRALLLFAILTSITTFIFMPYAFLDYGEFLKNIQLQFAMNSNPYIFPYTLQYVGTIPYWYYLKSIALWGLGPIISLFALIGFVILIRQKQTKQLVIYYLFYIIYFLVLGRSAVKFMRYALPLYPFFAVCAGFALYNLEKLFSSRLYKKLCISAVLVLAGWWTLGFIAIYTRPNTRLLATNWIIQHIPKGSIIAIEHWDDRLPIIGQEQYQFIELPLYNQPDNAAKWKTINEQLKTVDYIIIASNRLYTPIQNLANCSQYVVCYPKAARYYKKLFAEKARFKKVAEFTSFPTWSIGEWSITLNDQLADESFTVYDHPVVMMFKRTTAQ